MKISKRVHISALIMAVGLLLTTASGCGVAQSDYDDAVAQRDRLQTEQNDLQTEYNTLNERYNTLNTEHEMLKSEHDTLIANTTDWLKMSEDEKAAQMANAEVERIAAEEVAKKAAEERAAEDAKKAAEEKAAAEKAEAERIAAEEKANKEKVGIKDVLLEPLNYYGEFVRITSDWVIASNNVDRKSFSCFLLKERRDSGYNTSDTDFSIEIFYEDMSDWKKWGQLSEDNQIIHVAGTVYTYSNNKDSCYIKASEITIVE
jgi:hypothetical protein